MTRASITRLGTKLREAEAKKDELGICDLAQKLLKKLESLDSDLKIHHSAIIDLVKKENNLDREQDVLDQHDYEVLDLSTQLHLDTSPWLDNLHKSFEIITEAVSKLSEADDICLIRLYDEQLVNFKHELDDICKSMFSTDEVEDDELSCKQADIDKKLFECWLTVKRLLEWRVHSTAPSTSSSHEGVKLLKLDVPSFYGNILNWKTFLFL